MKKMLLLLLLMPAFSFAQSLAGKWESKDEPGKMMELKNDGTVMFDGMAENEEMAGVVIKYRSLTEDGKKYLLCEVFVNGEQADSQKNVYRLEGDTLTIVDNADEVEPGKSPDNVFTRVKG